MWLVYFIVLEGSMTSPPREIEVTCPDCGHLCQDWYRPSINVSLDSLDDEQLEEATTCASRRY